MTWWSDDALEHETDEATEPAHHVEVAIVGAGFAGIGAAIQLQRAGRESFVVLEKAQALGGTWRDNTYPGVACDIPSHLYSFSFSPNPTWSRVFAPGGEIRAYLEHTADAEGVRDRIVSGAELLDATWDAAADCWRLTTTRGDWTADALLLACGRLVEPAIPVSAASGGEVGGAGGAPPTPADLGSFTGPIFHSARWRHDVDLAGARVAVVGTGASAVQLVPELAAAGAQVTVFQRSAPWVMPRGDREYSADELAHFETDPSAVAAVRNDAFAAGEAMFSQRLGDPAALAAARARALDHLHSQVTDARLRRILTPDYEIGCKRVLFSDDWYPAIATGRVDLEPSAFAGVATGDDDSGQLVAASGRRIDADVLIFATGFETAEQPYARLVDGAGGRSFGSWTLRVIPPPQAVIRIAGDPARATADTDAAIWALKAWGLRGVSIRLPGGDDFEERSNTAPATTLASRLALEGITTNFVEGAELQAETEILALPPPPRLSSSVAVAE